MSKETTDTDTAPDHDGSWKAIGRPLAHVVAGGIIGTLLGGLDAVLATGSGHGVPLAGDGREAAIGLSLALIVPVLLAIGAFVGLCAWGLTRLCSAAQFTGWLERTWARILIGTGGVVVGAVGAYVLARKQIEWAAVDWTLPWMLLLGAAGYCLLVWVAKSRRMLVLLVGLSVVVGVAAAGTLAYRSSGEARAEALTRLADDTVLTKRVLRRLVPMFDGDGDGFPSSLCASGCDCNDSDAAINPGANDVAGNGIDEDCNGVDATLEAEAEYAALFGSSKPGAKGGTSTASVPPKVVPKRKTAIDLPGPTGSPMSGILPRVPGGRLPPRKPLAKGEKPTKPATVVAKTAPKPEIKKPEPKPRRPNILMITVDTLRADHLGLYGYERDTSPQLDRWAKEAVVFEQARTTGPSTRFSVAPALLSKWFTEIKRGKYEWPVVSDDETFLAERLKGLGYRTSAFHSIRYFRKQYGFTQGFDHYSVDALDKRGPPLNMTSSDFITDEALAYVDGTLSKGNEPWFMWTYYGDPHSAYIFHKGFPRFGPLYRDTYDNEIAFTDHHIGRLFEGLKKRGQWDNTVVILWSDHGEGLNPAEDHGAKYHSKNVYDELVRVPLIVSGPGMKARRVATAVSMIDMVPTLMDWLRVPLDPEFRGVSLVPYIEGENPPHPPTFSEKHRKKDNPQKAMVMWPHKIIVHFPQMHVEIYDLSLDPKERNNIASTVAPETRDRLMGVFKHWLTKVLRPQKPNYRH